MSDWLWAIYIGIGVLWFLMTTSFWWECYKDDDAAARRQWARATLLTPIWPLVALRGLARLLRALGVEASRRMPRVGQVIGDFALDAKGRSNDD